MAYGGDPFWIGFISPSNWGILKGHGVHPNLEYIHPREAPVPVPWLESGMNPPPQPWHARFFIAAVASKIAAANMTDREAAQQIIAEVDQSIDSYLDSDDICPRWPFPGPPPWLSAIATELATVAGVLPEGALRDGVAQIAGRVLDRAQTQANTR